MLSILKSIAPQTAWYLRIFDCVALLLLRRTHEGVIWKWRKGVAFSFWMTVRVNVLKEKRCLLPLVKHMCVTLRQRPVIPDNWANAIKLDAHLAQGVCAAKRVTGANIDFVCNAYTLLCENFPTSWQEFCCTLLVQCFSGFLDPSSVYYFTRCV